MIVLQILTAWLLADFVSGIIHWWQDRYLTKRSRPKFLQFIAEANELHHTNPSAMGQFSVWKNMSSSVIFTLPMTIGCFFFGAPMFLWLGFFFGTFANVVHRYTHIKWKDVPLVVRLLQKTGLFLSPEHHRVHHFAPGKGVIPKSKSSIRYCPMTNWLNPILDKIRLFKFLEFSLRKIGVNTI